MTKNKLTKVEVNVETGQTTEREFTAEEYAIWDADLEAEENRITQVQAKAQAKAELLERLGITADEAKLLLA
ncbi:hypothetical protein EB001_24830 [bacterium]|nr:hypothetical protein [bacterium]